MEDGRSKDDKMPGGMQQTVETNVGEVRVAEAKGGGGQRGSRKKTGRKEEEEVIGENSRGEKSGGRMGNLG